MTANTMREAFIQACKEYGPTISFSDFEMGWDACMAWQAAQSVPVEAELDALRKDAERYRWMRNHEKFNYRVHRATQIGGHEMDEAIDSAMQERQE